MLTNITFTAQQTANLVIQARAGLLKIASASNGVLGTVKAEGVTAGTPVSWSLQGNPGSAITISAKAGDPTQADITFTQVPVQADPYLLIVQASTQDGKQVQIPLAVVVREAFAIRETTRPSTSDFTVTGHTYDPNVASMAVKGYGPIGEVPGVKFIAPADLPPGLEFSVDGNDTAYLTVVQPTLEDPSGGLKVGAGTYSITVRAYREGTLYDTPDTAATLRITYDLTAGPTIGTLAFEVGGSYDTTERGVTLDAMLAYKGGQAQVHTMEWLVSGGAVGAWAVAPTASSLSALWKPSGSSPQDVTFTVNVKNAQGTIVATSNVGPFKVSGKDPNTTPDNNWSTSTVAPVVIYPAKLYPQEAGKKVHFRVAVPDLLAGETATVVVTPVAVDGAPAITDGPSDATLTGGSSTEAILGFTIPAASTVYDMWKIQVAVSITGGSSPRQGFAQLLTFSRGLTPLILQLADSTLSGNTGSFLNPVTVRAYQWVQNPLPGTPDNAYLNPVAGVWNSTLTEVSGATFLALGAPAGIAPVFQVGSGLYQLVGLIETVGTSIFKVQATKDGFTPATPVSATLLGQQSVTRLRFTDFSSTNPVVAGGQGFTLTWGYDGSGVITLQKGNVLPPDSVTGSLSAAMAPITTSTAYILRGTNSLGETFSAPMLVQFGATGSSTQLPPSPAIAVLDEANHLTVAWQPSMIGGSFTSYHHWVLSVKDAPSGASYALSRPGVTTNPTWVDGLAFGGTLDARRFEIDLGASGYHELSMQAFADSGQSATLNSKPWDTYKVFPAARPVTLDKSTASKGEAIAITVGAPDAGTGISGDRWQAVYSDGTTSDWFPMTITSVAKAFTQGGVSQTIKIVIESDYSTAFPPVKLRRTVTKSIFIQDQDYQGGSDPFDIGNALIGVGGEVGYEVTNNSDGSKSPQPYLVAVPALVRDDLTNELKLLVATTRGRDASSLLGTMAIDVFPLPGRPHTLDLVKLPGTVLVSEGTIYDPVKITQDALPDVIVGRNMTQVRLQASGGKRPYRWFAADLPFGLTLAVDGTLTGTVMKLGRFPINVSVQDAQNPSSIDNKTLYLNSKSDLSVKTTTVPSAQVGTLYGQLLEAQQGVQPYTWDLMAGELPHGLTLGLDGVVGGWPVVYHEDDFSTYTFVAQVTDAVGAKASKQFQLTLSPMALSLRSPDQPVLVQGVGYVLRFPIVGGKPGYNLVGQPNVPAGFMAGQASVVNGAVEIQVSDAFTTAFTSINVGITVRDTLAAETTQQFSIQIEPGCPVTRWGAASVPARITSTSTPVPVPTVGTVTGTAFDAVEVLPPAQNFTAVGDAALGQVRVQPPVVQGGNEELTFRITLKQGPITLGKISREFSVQTLAGTTTKDWTVNALPLRVGEFFVMDPQAPAFNASTPTPLAPNKARVKATSQLPTGVSLDPVTGHLYGAIHTQGTPARSVLEFVDSADTVISTVGVDWAILGTSIQLQGTLPPVAVGQLYSGALAVVGAGVSPTVDLIHGRLPEGLTLGYSNSQVTLTGRPLETGYFDLFIRVKDATNQSGLFYTRLVVNYLPYLAVLTPAIPKITSGFTYSFKLQATGGKPGYTWALAPGSTLPTGTITLSSDGTLSGLTNDTGFSGPVTFVVTDTFGQTATAALNVTVGAADPLVVTTTSLPAGVVGATYIGLQLQASGGVPAYSWPQVTLPAGLALDSATGIISGTPTAAFDQDITFTVTDAQNTQTTKVLRLTIIAASGFRISTDTLPQGRVGQAYNAAGGGGTAASFQLATAPPTGRVAGNFIKVKYQGKLYVMGICGLGSWAVRSGGALVSDPLHPGEGSLIPEPASPTPVTFFDPDVVVNGVRVGAWADAVQSWRLYFSSTSGYEVHPNNILGRMFAACVQTGETQFVLIGGAHTMNDGNISGIQGRSMAPGARLDGADSPVGAEYSPIVFVQVSETPAGVTFVMTPCRSYPWNSQHGVHGMCATLLNDGRIFLAGGLGVTANYINIDGNSDGIQMTADGHVPPRGAYILSGWGAAATAARVADLPVQQLICAQAVTLKDGRVLVIGGLQSPLGAPTSLMPSSACYIYTPGTNSWAVGPSLPSVEYGHSAVVLSDGRVVVGGDRDEGTSAVSTPFYILDPAATQWTTLVAHQGYTPNAWGAMVALPDDTIFYAGGTENGTYQLTEKSVLLPSGPTYQDGYNAGPNGTQGVYYTALQRMYHNEFSRLYAIAPMQGKWGALFVTPGSTNGGASGFTLQATGGVQPYNTWSMTPNIPGMSIHTVTGMLSGTPTDGFDGPVTFSVNDSTAPAASGPLVTTKPIRLTITDPDAPQWVTTSIPGGKLAQAYSVQLAAKDSAGNNLTGNFTISPLSGWGLPAGITLSKAGLLSGTTDQGWSRKVVFRITHPTNPTRFSDKEFLVEFVCGTALAQTSIPDVTGNGATYDVTLTATGGKAPYQWAIGSALPNGLSIDANTGRISGTCTETTPRNASVTVSVSDANGCTDSKTYNFKVRTVSWTITPTTLTAIRGQVFDQTLQVAGSNGSNTWNIQGLPTGFNANTSTGRITSASAVTTAVGAYPLSVTVTDSTGANTTTTVTLNVVAPSYVWRGGPNYNLNAYASAPLTLGAVWARDAHSKLGGPGGVGGAGGFFRGDPWAITIAGIRSASPTLTITDTSAPGLKWVAAYTALNGGVGFWSIYLNVMASDGSAINSWSGTHTLRARLDDGGTVQENDLTLEFIPSGSIMPAGETFKDSNGAAPPYAYYDGTTAQP